LFKEVAAYMRIEAHDDYRIAVELSDEDMDELEITYEDLDYSNIETRRVLWTILDEARQALGKEINLSEKMLIEAVPSGKGGCTIYFTVLQKPSEKNIQKLLVKKEVAPVICEFSDVNALIDLSIILIDKISGAKSELYIKDNTYRLLLFPETAYKKRIEAVASEFCDVKESNHDTVSLTREHWKKLSGPYAVNEIGIY